MNAPIPGKPAPRVTLWQVTRAFLRVGLTSFGGGRQVYFHEELVRRRGWLRDAEFLEGMALCQLLPGPSIANLSVYLGQRLYGSRGALVAALAVILPGAVLMTLLSAVYFAGLQFAGTEAAFRGAAAASVALVLVTVRRVGPQGLRARGGWPLAGLVFLGVGLLRLDMFLVVLPAAALGIWLNRPQPRPPV